MSSILQLRSRLFFPGFELLRLLLFHFQALPLLCFLCSSLFRIKLVLDLLQSLSFLLLQVLVEALIFEGLLQSPSSSTMGALRRQLTNASFSSESRSDSSEFWTSSSLLRLYTIVLTTGIGAG